MIHAGRTLLTLFLALPVLAEPEPTILIAYDSRTGNTERMARAIADGVSELPGIRAVVKRTSGVQEEDIVSSSGIILGSPVHWGSLSAESKSFLERVGDALVRAKELGPGSTPKLRTAGAFVSGSAVSSGKELARIAILAGFLNMRFVAVGGEEADGFGNLGAQATTGESDPGLSEKEISEARRFGVRFATVTLAVVQ